MQSRMIRSAFCRLFINSSLIKLPTILLSNYALLEFHKDTKPGLVLGH
jgi:hypothetical protein